MIKKSMRSRGLELCLTVGCVFTIITIYGCNSGNTSNVVVAEYVGGQVFDNDLPRKDLFFAEERLYRTKLSLINRTIERVFPAAEAKKRGISVNEFMQRHVDSGSDVSDEIVNKRYTDILERVNRHPQIGKLPDEKRKTRILEMLNIEADPTRSFQELVMGRVKQQFRQRKERKTIQKMARQANIEIYLDAPKPPVYAISENGSPAMGPRTAPVTIVVYSDFECPYSARAHPDLKRLVTEFPDQVRLVFRHYPLLKHRYAQHAAEAATLAHDQGKFWEYHDLLFANQDKLDTHHLYGYARRLELDMNHFEQGMANRKHKTRIETESESGKRYGVRGTPAIYINGKPRRPRSASYYAELLPFVQEELIGAIGRSTRDKTTQSGLLAKVSGVKITEADLSETITLTNRPRDVLYRPEEMLYYLKLKLTRGMLKQRLTTLEAGSRGISVDSLYRAEIGSLPDIREVEKQYAEFQGYVTNNPRLMHLDKGEREAEILKLLEIQVDTAQTFKEQVLSKLTGIEERLRIERLEPVLIAKLMRKYNAAIKIKTPVPPTYEIDTRGHPSLGSETAPVTVVMFSDFQCPYSQKILPTIHEVLNRYPEAVRFVFRHFPLPHHGRAQLAHEASECARDQGGFWQYHDQLFADQNALAEANLKKHAADLGMDLFRFKSCLETRRFEEKVRRDVREASAYHVNSTPSFFVNGTPRNLRSLDQFAWYITGGQEGDPSIKTQLASAGSACR